MGATDNPWRTAMSRDYPAVPLQRPPLECFPGVWFIASQTAMSLPLGLTIYFSRNMTAVLGADGWVLLNPVRLTEDAEAQLLARGPFAHAVRLGTYHGRDDRYYVDRFGVELWGIPGEQTYPEPSFRREITEDGPFPIPDAKVVIFRNASRPECVVRLPEHRLLVTCDSVQHYDNDPLISTLGKLVMYPMGFFSPCVIGPVWLKNVTPPGGSVRADFERVLALDFDNLISAHGTPKIGGAKHALAANVAKLP
jgi:hypothetical protein